jgi:hypothetical protein
MVEPIEDMTARREFDIDRTPKRNVNGPCSPGAYQEPTLQMWAIDIEWYTDDGKELIDTIQMPVLRKHVNEYMKQLMAHCLEKGILSVDMVIDIQNATKEVLRKLPKEKDIAFLEVETGRRKVIKDQINVLAGSSIQHIVTEIEKRRVQLEKNLNLSA